MSKSKNKQKTAPTTVWSEYGDAFSKLQDQSQSGLNRALGQTGNIAGQVQSGLSGMLNNPAGGAAGWMGLNRLGSVGGGNMWSNMAAGQLGQIGRADANYNQATSALRNLANPSGYDPQLAAYSRQVGQNFNENIMPGITQGALASGSLGGSRGQVGAAQAAGAAQRNIQDFAGQQYNQQQNRALQAAGQLGDIYGLQQQNLLGAGQAAGSIYNQGQQNVLGAGQALAGMFGQGQTANLGALSLLGKVPTLYQQPYLNQRQILGSPITIGGGGSASGKSFGI
jgi:hypothetical protein